MSSIMNKKFGIVIVVGLLMFPTLSSAQDPNWTWSSDLKVGDVYSWTVEEMREGGVLSNEYHIPEGLIEAEIIGNVDETDVHDYDEEFNAFQFTFNNEIQELFYNARYYKITFIFAMQFPLGMRLELRSQFDYVFLLRRYEW